ncbi:hypothetical protein ABB37_07529 [Leptomonas pyrrhocoris]|uniref:Uncharacterized protein n=1 Tax=Leptomonas pyrrhocoris TaxID=157538 RepID=A0A0M9FV29_LEPPY|nr:hypothetical protein ABB37_07529 [Leptomonas pyrrhocoris]KPA76680.1 hypothetical protein ABB37_07529 [Leptomonas pyrrhocoris]|eukprot:XP_015655119.1 hypothetical protein ABB37_07529 [Leptomonas pyrrhocoris]
MSSPQPNVTPPGARLPGETSYLRSSLTVQHTLALTSKQRAISVDLLQAIARLLRGLGPRLEAAALQEAVQDPEASEFVSAVTAHAEANGLTDGAMTSSFSTASPSSSNVDGGSRPSLSPLTSFDEALATVKLAAVLRTRNTASAKAKEDAATTAATTANGASSVRTRPWRVSSVNVTTSTPLDVPSATRSQRSSFENVRRRSIRRESIGKDISMRTDHQDSFAYRFPPDWFAAAAIERLSGSHSASNPSTADRGEHRAETPPRLCSLAEGHARRAASVYHTPTITPPPSLSPSSHVTRTKSTPVTVARVSAEAAPSFVSSPSKPPPPRPTTAAATSTPTKEHTPPSTGPAATVFRSPTPFAPAFPTQVPSRPNSRSAPDDRCTVITAQPPLFVDNMLLDPSSGAFLFGGHAFREEARVLYVPPARSMMASATMTGGNSELLTSATQPGTADRAPDAVVRGSGSSRHATPAALLLVREYFPVFPLSAFSGFSGRSSPSIDAGAAPLDDIVIQSFSLLPQWLTQVPPNRYHVLSEAVTIACVCQALPGCVTVTTPLSRFLRGDRAVSLTTALHGSQQASQLIGTFSAFGDVLRTAAGDYVGLTSPPFPPLSPGGSAVDAPLQSHSFAGAVTDSTDFASPPCFAMTLNPVSPASPAEVGSEEEAPLITAVAERLSAVPPDVLDESLTAVRHSLAFYAEYVLRRQRIRDVLTGVRVLQRFFRRCLAVKRRAVRRMMRIWRKLEVEARLKLQQHRTLPSAVERIDAVANSILQEHMLTSVDYKRKFVEDEWVRRRAAFAQWKEEEEWDALFAEEWQAQTIETTAHISHRDNSEAGDVDVEEKDDAMEIATPEEPCCSSPARPRSARLTAKEEQHMEDAFQRRIRQRLKSQQTTGCPLPTLSTKSPLVAAGVAAVESKASSPSLAEAQAQRYQGALRRYCSWYIDPHELLFLSHQRLLETLKGTVLRMEEVQSELSRAATEAAGEATTKSSSNA